MITSAEKLELVQLLLQEQKASVLRAIKKLLQRDDNQDIQQFLDMSEEEYQAGKYRDFEAILQESKEKYFRKWK